MTLEMITSKYEKVNISVLKGIYGFNNLELTHINIGNFMTQYKTHII